MRAPIDRPGLVRPVRRDPTGRVGPTPAQTRSKAWRRTSHGFYVPAHVGSEVPEQRIIETAAALPAGTSITGWAALRWWTGSRWFAGRGADGGPAPIAVVSAQRRTRARSGAVVSEERVDEEDQATLDGVALVRPCAAVSFEVRRRAPDLCAAVVVVDMACSADAVSLSELSEIARRQSGWEGVERLRAAVGLAEENSWSPQESRTRWRWLAAGLGRPRCNAAIFDLQGRHLITPDLLDGRLGLVAEYDGAEHRAAGARLRDVRREEVYAELGIEWVTTLAGDRGGNSGFAARLRRAAARAGARPDTGRTWTLAPPRWWVPTDTVERRRALTPDQQRRFLGYRRDVPR